MSKSDGRRFCQPIPLSSILDPTYRSPFSKLQQFQVDMEISSKMCHQQQQPRPSVWRKLQSTLMSAMSNLVVISHPVFSTQMMSRSSSCMSLVPWKSFKACDLLLPESEVDFSKTTEKTVPEAPSLYYSIRSGLECLRYFATHPLSYEESIRKQNLHHCDPQQDHCKQTNIVPQPDGHTFIGGTFFLPFLSESSCTAFSAPTTPSHHRSPARFPIPNLFSLAMSGLLISSPQHPDRVNSFYKNCYLFSPMQGQRSMSTPSSPQKSRILDTPSLSPTAEAEFEIFIQSMSTSQDPFCSKLSESSSPTPCARPAEEVPSTMSAEAGCIRIETNWRSKNAMSQEDSTLTNFHTMSVCSPSSPSKGGTLTFSCSSTLSSAPKPMATSCISRRRKTESESSTDSFIEFSASVESTDSFCIVFEPAGSCIDEEVLSREEDDDDDDEQWQDEDSDEDDSDDGEDRVFNYSSSGMDDLFMDGVIFQADGIDCGDQVDFCFKPELLKKKKLKNVSFNEEQLESVIEFEDDTDSKSSRETYWEMLARDRARFQDRIFRTGDILEPILEPAHRSKVFQQRFCPDN